MHEGAGKPALGRWRTTIELVVCLVVDLLLGGDASRATLVTMSSAIPALDRMTVGPAPPRNARSSGEPGVRGTPPRRRWLYWTGQDHADTNVYGPRLGSGTARLAGCWARWGSPKLSRTSRTRSTGSICSPAGACDGPRTKSGSAVSAGRRPRVGDRQRPHRGMRGRSLSD